MIALLMCVHLLGYAKQKRALVICVSEQEDKSWSAINAENDAIYVKALLNTCGYDDMCILTGKNTTKQAIVDAFVSLTSRCCAGDLIYVHFSGHVCAYEILADSAVFDDRAVLGRYAFCVKET